MQYIGLIEISEQNLNESANDKTYNKTCATSEDSDQTAQMLISCAFYSLQVI